VAVALIALAGVAHTANVQRSDNVALQQLILRSDQVALDISQASSADTTVNALTAQHAAEAVCMLLLLTDSQRARDAVHEPIYISSANGLVTSPNDQLLTSRMTVAALGDSLNTLVELRADANRVSGECASSPLVVAKAQELLGLLSDADPQLSALKARLDQ
jgi:hypothetical protein